MNELAPVAMTIQLLGGLALFLYGMEKMTDGLKAAAGKQMNVLLARLTGNRILGAITGAIVTAVIQSSSVTTVLVVGFVSAGLLTLTQSVGVIFGANVGTTMTAQIVAFNTTALAYPLIAIGFFLTFFQMGFGTIQCKSAFFNQMKYQFQIGYVLGCEHSISFGIFLWF